MTFGHQWEFYLICLEVITIVRMRDITQIGSWDIRLEIIQYSKVQRGDHHFYERRRKWECWRICVFVGFADY